MENTVEKIKYVVPECTVYEFEIEGAVLANSIGSDESGYQISGISDPKEGGTGSVNFGSGAARGW